MSTVAADDDINSSTGFLKALLYVMSLSNDGLFWVAPPCSSWVWLSRGSSHRSKDNILGNDQYKNVRIANEQASRVALLILIALLLHNAIFVAEQPSSTLLPRHPRWELLKNVLGTWFQQVEFYMQPYGGKTPKRTWLCSNCESISKLVVPYDPDQETTLITTETVLDHNGNTQVNGTKQVKETQAYPARFGEAVARTYANEVTTNAFGEGVGLDNLDQIQCSDDPWEDANLEEVLRDLERARMTPHGPTQA